MKIINTSKKNIKGFLKKSWIDEILAAALIFLVLIISFSLGSWYQQFKYKKNFSIKIAQNKTLVDSWDTLSTQKKLSAKYFASKNGSKVYPVGCTAGNRVKTENKVFFQNSEEAQALGYETSSRC